MTRVKICGITRLEDALAAIECGADALGFVFAPSPRRVTPEKAAEIIAGLPPLVSTVGVFVDFPLEAVRRIASLCRLGAVQLHGSETPEYCAQLPLTLIKAFRVKDDSVLNSIGAYNVAACLLDGYSPSAAGGTGIRFDWDIARRAGKLGRTILSGGLTPENVRQAITEASPYAVDACSGVESRPGEKDKEEMRRFISEAKSWR